MKILVWAAFVLAAQSLHAQTPQENGAQFASAIEAVSLSDWEEARSRAAKVSEPIAAEIVEWYYLRAGQGTFAQYENFLIENSDWPDLSKIRIQAEAALPEGLPSSRVLAFFNGRPPLTGTGVLRLDAAMPQSGSHPLITQAWRDLELSSAERSLFLAQFPGDLAAIHGARLDTLLWAGKRTAAREMLPLVDAGQRALANARLALQEDLNGVDALIKAIPARLRDDAGLAYDRFSWRAKKGYTDSAVELLIARSQSAESLGRPEKWASRRRSFARRAMREGDFERAYQIASQSFLTSGSNYADLEWLSGYLSLRKLNQPRRALQHFRQFRAEIASPISMGRAGYWLGETYMALEDTEAAYRAYAFGARFQTSFYGQLAASRAGISPDASLSGAAFPPDWTIAPFLTNDSVRAGVLFYFAGEPARARQFLTHEASRLPLNQQAALAQLMLDLDEPHIALRIAKVAARTGAVLPSPYYPLHGLAEIAEVVPAELAMAIARQESEMNPAARSPVGALGLMQVMPATARTVARELDIAYSGNRLAGDWKYNARIGTTYLAQMLERFDGAVLLAAAAYNAGPNRAERWIKDFGDPRRAGIDAIEWIESIPYRETRNYVMRVLEAQFVYRARVSGAVGPLTLSAELQQNDPVITGDSIAVPRRPPRRR